MRRATTRYYFEMAFKYEEAVPWGRSFDEYCRMFDLTTEDLLKNILGCADGPASFNAEMRVQGRRVISCDPLYQFTREQIQSRIDATYNRVITQTRDNQHRFVWNVIRSIEDLSRTRMAAMQKFLTDYEDGHAQGRYVAAELPDLPFGARAFDIALSSHFLFLYGDLLSLEFHKNAVDELCRVARDVRIFPLLTYNAEPSPLVMPIVEHIEKIGRTASVRKVPYEFQRGGNMMLAISA
jgi:hypothetical protein